MVSENRALVSIIILQKLKIQRLFYQSKWSEAVKARYIKVLEKVNILITHSKQTTKQSVLKFLNSLKVKKK
ncbi:hypothetical protein CVO_08495 [Sulfurimonas sp. CVO]|nr:hypothetical protein CVO_08495 [Sulfurimonas sp. CVO]